MSGRPFRRTGQKPSRARRTFNDNRDRLLALANALDRIQPGAGDELLNRAAGNLARLIEARQQALSSFPPSES